MLIFCYLFYFIFILILLFFILLLLFFIICRASLLEATIDVDTGRDNGPEYAMYCLNVCLLL